MAVKLEGDAAFSKYVKGVPIINKSYTKELPFPTKLLYVLGTGLYVGAKPPLYKTLLSTPARVWGISKKIRRLSMKSGVVIKVDGS